MVFYSKWMFISNLTLTLCHYLSDGKRRNVSTNSVSTVNNHHIAHRQSSKHRVAVVSTMCKYFPSLWLCLISVIIILECMQWDLRGDDQYLLEKSLQMNRPWTHSIESLGFSWTKLKLMVTDILQIYDHIFILYFLSNRYENALL